MALEMVPGEVLEDVDHCRVKGDDHSRRVVFILPHKVIVDGLGKAYRKELADKVNLLTHWEHVRTRCTLAYNARRHTLTRPEDAASVVRIEMTVDDFV